MSTNGLTGLTHANALIPGSGVPTGGAVIAAVAAVIGAARVVHSETVVVSGARKICVWAFRPECPRYEGEPDKVFVLYKENDHFVRWEQASEPCAQTVATLKAAADKRKAKAGGTVPRGRPHTARAVENALAATLGTVGGGYRAVVEPIAETSRRGEP